MKKRYHLKKEIKKGLLFIAGVAAALVLYKVAGTIGSVNPNAAALVWLGIGVLAVSVASLDLQ